MGSAHALHKKRSPRGGNRAGFIKSNCLELEMNDCNFNGVRIKKADWARMCTFSKRENGVWMILTAGEYRPVLIVD
jgi:hypothetical protein